MIRNTMWQFISKITSKRKDPYEKTDTHNKTAEGVLVHQPVVVQHMRQRAIHISKENQTHRWLHHTSTVSEHTDTKETCKEVSRHIHPDQQTRS